MTKHEWSLIIRECKGIDKYKKLQKAVINHLNTYYQFYNNTYNVKISDKVDFFYQKYPYNTVISWLKTI